MKRRLFALLVLVAACGPQSPLDVIMNQAPTSLKIGGQDVIHQPAPQQQAPVAVPLGPIDFGPLPPPPITGKLPPPPSLGDCGTSVFTHISDAAISDAPFAPAEATYPYRLSGTYQADGTQGKYPARVTRAVTNVHAVSQAGNLYDSAYAYDVVETKSGSLTTTYSYLVVPENAATNPAVLAQGYGVNAADPAGIYLTAISSNDPSSIMGATAFHPAPAIKILPIAAARSINWTTQGADSSTASSLTLSGTVVDRSLVDACGHVLEGWQVYLSGNVASLTGRNGTLEMFLTIGTEYGGLVLAESILESASTNGVLDFLSETGSVSAQVREPQGSAAS